MAIFKKFGEKINSKTATLLIKGKGNTMKPDSDGRCFPKNLPPKGPKTFTKSKDQLLFSLKSS